MNKRTLKRAIGLSNGKSLLLANDCARVEITQELLREDTASLRESMRYTVAGDADDRSFTDLSKALDYAVTQLALYMDGSPNR